MRTFPSNKKQFLGTKFQASASEHDEHAFQHVQSCPHGQALQKDGMPLTGMTSSYPVCRRTQTHQVSRCVEDAAKVFSESLLVHSGNAISLARNLGCFPVLIHTQLCVQTCTSYLWHRNKCSSSRTGFHLGHQPLLWHFTKNCRDVCSLFNFQADKQERCVHLGLVSQDKIKRKLD